MALTEEDLKKLSPEEILELQKKNCIFCQIVKGVVNSRKIYEDDKVVAILDINPANPGHTLLLPKEHYTILPQIPEDLIAHLFIVAKAISKALLKALKATGTNIFIANGAAAGQRAPHFMIHIIPRTEGDSIKVFELPESRVKEEELEKLRSVVSQILKSMVTPEDKTIVLKEEPEVISSRKPKDEDFGDKNKGEDKKQPANKKNEEKSNESRSKPSNNKSGFRKQKRMDLDKLTELLLGKNKN